LPFRNLCYTALEGSWAGDWCYTALEDSWAGEGASLDPHGLVSVFYTSTSWWSWLKPLLQCVAGMYRHFLQKNAWGGPGVDLFRIVVWGGPSKKNQAGG